jgi:hypothetical protein
MTTTIPQNTELINNLMELLAEVKTFARHTVTWLLIDQPLFYLAPQLAKQDITTTTMYESWERQAEALSVSNRVLQDLLRAGIQHTSLEFPCRLSIKSEQFDLVLRGNYEQRNRRHQPRSGANPPV